MIEFQPWRDHWMQAIYYPISVPKISSVQGEQKMVLISCHDEYSFWFDLSLSKR